MSLGGICYILLPNKFLCVASAQATAFSTGEDGQDAPVDTPAQSVGLQVVEQMRHDLGKGGTVRALLGGEEHSLLSTDQTFLGTLASPSPRSTARLQTLRC